MEQHILSLSGLGRSFGVPRAGNAVTLDIRAGQFVGVIGRSGAGKSMLLRLINRLVEPTEGRISSGGEDITALQPIRFPVLPQLLLSISFESNVRAGAILSTFGAGGIGFLLADRIDAYRWDEAWSIIFLIIGMVYLIDAASAAIRGRIIGTWEPQR
ncbi:ATP-binding cassette domain-containing protein [Cereibacter changlensis]|uniref:ATP-binding cassette domain-containing protein n=1 Tax=Cereibacter changlensis TaxID=402884 RepID=A0A4V6WLP7_9RHOB|nr:ATP-binding cassette domain-containing protein [Cereibacter changlensis]TKA95547.1 ATP-binding cassette domain-containing protein [Cereibacter changlensis]